MQRHLAKNAFRLCHSGGSSREAPNASQSLSFRWRTTILRLSRRRPPALACGSIRATSALPCQPPPRCTLLAGSSTWCTTTRLRRGEKIGSSAELVSVCWSLQKFIKKKLVFTAQQQVFFFNLIVQLMRGHSYLIGKLYISFTPEILKKADSTVWKGIQYIAWRAWVYNASQRSFLLVWAHSCCH